MPSIESKTQNVQLIRVIDGDTVVVRPTGGIMRSQPEERIRLWGIDAPESQQNGGPQSTKYLQKLIGHRRKIYLTSTGRDQYGRLIGVIHPDGHTLNNSYNYLMVEGGHAHCYMLSGPDSNRYRRAEKEAKEHRRGMWAARSAQHPTQWRKEHAKKGGFPRWVWLALAAGLGLSALWAATNCQNPLG